MKTYLEEYEHLLESVTDRTEQVRGFDKFLAEKTNWRTAPASTRFHLAEEGGLMKHSINAAKTLLKLKETLRRPDVSDESCVIVALFHDVGKVG